MLALELDAEYVLSDPPPLLIPALALANGPLACKLNLERVYPLADDDE